MSASMAVRSLRAAVFAVLCVLLAAGGHALATGVAPAAWVQIVAAAPVFVGACLLGGRERSLVGIGAGTLASQGALHVAFHTARPHSAMLMHGMRMSPSSAHAPGPHALTSHATAAHLVAALALTWWLRRGEAALWSLLRWAVAFVPGLAAWWRLVRDFPGGSGTPARVRIATGGTRPLRQTRLRYAVHRRGPPTRTSYAI
ncbi:hypothetical protein KMT30_03505 [Streptomyces sp. IBSBF 2953]|uniref:hypothetical protein n=1 Tax=Streptomyces TaxID=1883 RepID=UPI00211A9EAB|nr:hypothetical protein [Streptomyces scabiei]MCQ9178121.1 hypothetical protein [Streptomyces hayashii]MDX3114788.1 hypothetical protein [Streptomyces scabiei]